MQTLHNKSVTVIITRAGLRGELYSSLEREADSGQARSARASGGVTLFHVLSILIPSLGVVLLIVLVYLAARLLRSDHSRVRGTMTRMQKLEPLKLKIYF